MRNLLTKKSVWKEKGQKSGEYIEYEEPDIKLEKSVEASQEESERCREIGYDWPHIKLKIESDIKQEDTTEDEKQDEEQRKEDSISSIVMTEYGIKLEPSLKLEPDAQMETDVEGRS